jgi:PAS domain S-box-containing protein
VVFAIALAVSIIGAVVLSWIFANSVSRPLIHLTENSRLLSRREPLLPPLSTGEQFAKLDQDLYMVADAIETAMLREKELIEEAADLICALDADGAIKSVNSYARALLGLSTDELIGRSILELVYVEDCVSLDQKFKDARQALSKTDFECRLVDSAGRIIDTRWYAFWSPVETALFCVVHDIREEKKLERLKEDYLNMVSHDLRSPLMSMQASMDLIAAGGKGVVAPAVKSEVEEAARSIERLTALVNDLLDFQKLRAGKIQLDLVSFDLKDLLAEACEMVNALARKKGVSIKLPETSATVRADRSKLRQSLVNLLSNAVKFSPDNQEVVVSVLLADDSFEIRVADKGPGVPGEYQEKIFEAFEQVPAAASGSIGSGLGLAIHKMIVLAHGGSLGVQSDGSSYSVFWFNIPKIPA